jgi:glycosyltransferase involved in cell wall biosynthesis
MLIAFLTTSPVLSGGVNVIYEHAIRINRRGRMTVYMITENTVNLNELAWHPDAQELNWLTYKEAENMMFDAVIATWWETCYDAYRVKSRLYFYFNQVVESTFYPSYDLLNKLYADSTYFLGFNIITEATWIKSLLEKSYGIKANMVLNGIRKDIYQLEGPVISERKKGKLRVLVEGSLDLWYKNTKKAIELCLQSKADEIWLLTISDIKNYKGVNKVFSRVPIIETANIYRSCDVIVKLSYAEGMFGPPLEMFHCGGTAIVYDVTGHDEYIKDNVNGFIVKTNDEGYVINRINFLKNNPDELERLKEGAIQTAMRWHDWEAASTAFENALLNSQEQTTQYQLQNNTLLFKQWYDISSAKNNFNYQNDINILQNEINALRHSKAYHLGKFILRPFSRIRTMFRKD